MLIQKHGEADILHEPFSAIRQRPTDRQTKGQKEVIDFLACSIPFRSQNIPRMITQDQTSHP